MLRPRSVPTMLRHLIWRAKNLVRSQLQPESSADRAAECIRFDTADVEAVAS